MYTQKKGVNCVSRAALCALRLNDLQYANEILSHELNQYPSINNIASTVRKGYLNYDTIGMIAIVQMENTLKHNSSTACGSGFTESNIKLLHSVVLSSVASPIYKYMYHESQQIAGDRNNNVVVPLIERHNEHELNILTVDLDDSQYYNDYNNLNNHIMVSPILEEFINKQSSMNHLYDDPYLIHLDDKVFLHQLLSSSSTDDRQYDDHYSDYDEQCKYWPRGFIVPTDINGFKKYIQISNDMEIKQQERWILKQRAGYGSHGNQIISTNERALELFQSPSKSDNDINSEKVLCQQVIDPALCYNGKRFSLRVYVIYFPSNNLSNSTFIYKDGLMKLASVEGKDDNDNNLEKMNDVYMTNSGRVESLCDYDDGQQYNFTHLEHFINNEHGQGSYGNLWNSIVDSTSDVMTRYINYKMSIQSRDLKCVDHDIESSLLRNVPKIMGFDYLLDTDLHPWLLEVNRFPGLQARGEIDWDVKSKLVQNTWKLAKERKGFASYHMLQIH